VITGRKHDGVQVGVTVVIVGVGGWLAVVDAPANFFAPFDDVDVDSNRPVAIMSLRVRSSRTILRMCGRYTRSRKRHEHKPSRGAEDAHTI
jgi:hypothetical protein